MREVVIVEAVRTPIGRRNGKLKDIHPVVLGSLVLKEIINRAGIKPEQVEDVVFGCVTQAGEQSLNVARSAWLTAGFPVTTPATTVDRQCGSSQQAIHFATNLIQSGVCDITIAGGVESMTRIPIGSNASYEAPSAPQPASNPKHSITAGNSSQISDGAAAVLLMSLEKAKQLGLKPRARIRAQAVVGTDPVLMLEGPIPGTAAVLKKAGLDLKSIDLFEVNEAFASVVLAWEKETGADINKTNVNGGAIAVGHPLGASGAILMNRLLYELERRDLRYGLETMCCGGGLGTATIIDRVIE